MKFVTRLLNLHLILKLNVLQHNMTVHFSHIHQLIMIIFSVYHTQQACCAICFGLILTRTSVAGVRMNVGSVSPLDRMWSASFLIGTILTSSAELIRFVEYSGLYISEFDSLYFRFKTSSVKPFKGPLTSYNFPFPRFL